MTLKQETLAIREQTARSYNREHSAPIYMTSSFVFDSAEQGQALFQEEEEGNIYSRFSNPNTTELINKICKLEQAESGLVTASGMAAMFSSMAALLKSGDHILASRSLFGSTHQILTSIFPNWGIEHTYVDINDVENWESSVQKNTKLIFLETPSNPGLDIIDLEKVGKLAKAHELTLVVDNCFATPCLQKPMLFGADLVTHSTTKLMDGQGRTIGGAIVGKSKLIEKIQFFNRHTGPSMSPFNAWILSKSLETLSLRMDKHCENALGLSKVLEKDHRVSNVKYPFLRSHPKFDIAKKQMGKGGALVTFSIDGGFEKASKFMNGLTFLSLTSNLGDTRTTVTHPASTTHSKLSKEERQLVGINEGLIRISVGLEHIDDIVKDIDQALKNV
ncbi:MAG: aminotransferase class I/II-fold pyridoxal phosphate-dependent enzyme [Bacteroidota bacterium]